MAFRIGFIKEHSGNQKTEPLSKMEQQAATPRKSIVQVYFAGRNMTLAYYNDRFDLHCGDIVYVDGKLEGMRGRVKSVNYNFKIKVSDYKRVIGVADTAVHGQFFLAGNHVIAFDRTTLPADRVLTWYKAPVTEEGEFVSSSDDTAFPLDDLQKMRVREVIAERGYDYYVENLVRYICLDGTKGFAIVEGNSAYEVEFEYRDGMISNLTCSCFCSYPCKHEVAAMLQLKEILQRINEHYAEEYKRTGYFAAMSKTELFRMAFEGKECGSFTL